MAFSTLIIVSSLLYYGNSYLLCIVAAHSVNVDFIDNWALRCIYGRERKFHGTKVPGERKFQGNESSRERKFPGTKVPGNESFKRTNVPWNESSRERKFPGSKVPRERKFHGTKVPRNESSRVELSLQGAKSLGNEKSWYHQLAISQVADWSTRGLVNSPPAPF